MNSTEKTELMLALQTEISVQEKLPLLYAGVLANNVINHFDPRLLEGVNLWVHHQLTPEFGVESVTLADFQASTNASLFGALCLMDVFLRDPDSMPRFRWSREVL